MDKAALLQKRFAHEEVELDGLGSITVRGLARGEVNELMAMNPDQNAFDRFVLSRAMVDPKMSEKDVEEWQKVSPPNEIGTVIEVVLRLSGLSAGAEKSGLQEAS